MSASKRLRFNTYHKDLIHDVCFDYYGQMIATCSSDQSIKIWKKSKDEWILQQELSHLQHTHKAAIKMICWAHPCFGSIFASCSTDKKVIVFALKNSFSAGRYSATKQRQKFYFERVYLGFFDAVSIAFAPKHLGLKLCVVCSNGMIKVLTARDITNLSLWTLEHSVQIEAKSLCICWNETQWERPSFTVGCNQSRIVICEHFDSSQSQSGSHRLCESKTTKRAKTNINAMKKCIDWHCVQTIALPNNASGKPFDIRGIAWSHRLAREHQSLAIGCSDGFVRIVQICKNRKERQSEWSLVFESNVHQSSVWKIKWNATGNVLLSAGDDAKIYLWKRSGKKYEAMCISENLEEEQKLE